MALELINATLKQGAADRITLQAWQSASFDLSEIVDLSFITGETIPQPYTGEPITINDVTLPGKKPKKITTSGISSYVINEDGSLLGFGRIVDSALNINNNYDKPVKIWPGPFSDFGKIEKIKSVTVGASHVDEARLFALTEDRELLEIHAANPLIQSDVLNFAVTYEYENVFWSGQTITNHLVIVETADGLLFRQGGNFLNVESFRTQNLVGKTITQLEAYGKKVVALCSDNTIFEIPGIAGNWTFQPVSLNGALSGKTVTRLVGGKDRIFAFCTDGTVAGLGANQYGKLGNGNDIPQQTEWAAVSMTGVLSGKTIADLSVGIDHTLFLCTDGTLAAVGSNSEGQLGNASLAPSVAPVKVYSRGYLNGKTIVDISAGAYHSAVITSDGSVLAWGSDDGGQLGNGGTNKDRAIPFPVYGIKFRTTQYNNLVRFSCADLPGGLDFDGDLIQTGKIVGTPSSAGIYDAIIKIDLSDFTLYDPIHEIDNSYTPITATGYFTLRIEVLQGPPPPPPPPPPSPIIIRNGNLLMDVGVSQNIKVTFNSVYQTFYTRVTGLPAGMRYTGSPDGFLSGFISGAPLASGSYNVTISTTYKASEGGETLNTSKTIVYTVNEPNAPTILLGNQNLTSGQSVNLPLRVSDVSAIIGWSATGLPAGLTCGTGASAAITGTPTTAGTYNSTISLSCRKISSSETTTVTKPVTFTIT